MADKPLFTEIDIFSAFFAGMDAYNDWLKEDETWEAVGGTPGYVSQDCARRMFLKWMDERGN